MAGILQDYAHVWTGLAAFGAVFTALMILVQSDRRVDNRIRSLTSNDDRRAKSDGFLHRLLRQLGPRNEASIGTLRNRLLHAGFQAPAAVSVFSTMQLLVGAVGALLGIWFARSLPPRVLDDLLGALLGGCLGFLAPGHYLKLRTRRRQQSLQSALPDFLDLMVACLDAGMSLEGALQRITDELQVAHPVLGSELARVQRDIELGATADRALLNFAERSDVDILRTLANACSQARRFGSRIATTLRSLADSLREQREQRAEEAAQIAAVKILLPTLILLFPIIFVVLAGPAAIQIVEQFSKTGMVNDRK
ncbi:Bacterial type II secretion system protein F domain protein [Caulifigura coniformis]|uniref:Bacterial type II secretion system protein F domain protein n=1 Tax=Caulifigura coniformis TaxID=2527983 RepID=A0A517SMV7_9PLAN|nr:type II secretion system F family protein [Caulifigura coniformis]QDT57458.1 Bacterial type II secretion system protein F domain protein [Caulifigura coniformis]